jgi:aminoglycoside phosphotransferase (APT) family kinase protein
LEPLVAIHGDLRPTNILVSADGRVTVLDSAIGKTGTRFHDLAHLYMHLEFLRWRPRLKSGIVGDVQHALLRGYDAAVSASDPLFVLMLLHHIVCHIAALTEHPARRVDPAHRWFVRRRWAKCSRVAGLGLKERSPKTAYTGTAVS